MLFDLAAQQPSDEEAGKDEEDIDPNEAPSHSRNAQMAAYYRKSYERSQSL